jgi:hypothetical protein
VLQLQLLEEVTEAISTILMLEKLLLKAMPKGLLSISLLISSLVVLEITLW